MTPEQVIEKFRTVADDLHEPFLWGDTELLGYLNHAQNEFVRFIGGIADTARITVHARQEFIRLPENLLKIREIRNLTHNKIMSLVNIEGAGEVRDDYSRSYLGASSELIVGEKDDCLVFGTPPSDSFELKIYYYRLPCTGIASKRSTIEVKSFWHDTLLKHVLYQAYSKQDADAHDPRLAAKYFAEFQIEAAQAREEKGRLEHVPRTVQYGGL